MPLYRIQFSSDWPLWQVDRSLGLLFSYLLVDRNFTHRPAVVFDPAKTSTRTFSTDRSATDFAEMKSRALRAMHNSSKSKEAPVSDAFKPVSVSVFAAKAEIRKTRFKDIDGNSWILTGTPEIVTIQGERWWSIPRSPWPPYLVSIGSRIMTDVNTDPPKESPLTPVRKPHIEVLTDAQGTADLFYNAASSNSPEEYAALILQNALDLCIKYAREGKYD